MIDKNINISVFNQVCKVNDLDPEVIRGIAKEKGNDVSAATNEAEHLIRTAFNYKAKQVVKELDLGSTSGSDTIMAGEEYTIVADPAAPSFTINADFIHSKYSEAEAKKLIEALGHVMLPVAG